MESDMKEEGQEVPVAVEPPAATDKAAPAAEAPKAAEAPQTVPPPAETPPVAQTPPQDAKPEPAAATPAPHDRLAALQTAETAAKAEIGELTAKYDDGDLTSAQFHEQLAAISDKRAEALAEIRQVQKQVADSDAQWFGMIGSSLESLAIKPNTAEIAIYDRIVKNAETQYPHLPDAEKIRLAEIEFRAMFSGAAPAKNANPPPAARPGAAPSDPDTYEIDPDDKNAFGNTVPSLRRVPTEGYTPNHSEFADIAALIESGDVAKYEQRLAKLTPEQLDRFTAYG